MTFQPGQSGNPAGRPLGARNKTTILAEQMLDGEAEALTGELIRLAKRGDAAALRLCMDRLLPPRKSRAVKFDLPPLTNGSDAVQALSAIVAAVAAGELTPAEAADLMKVVDTYARSFDLVLIEEKLARLERAATK